ncbi:MAG: hypothetical protein ACRD2W_02175 [Acidimicrobiales bacterium]
MSPSFDHASCLGFQISDAERLDRLAARGNRTVASYAAGARTKFEGRPSTFDAARAALDLASPEARSHWIGAVDGSPDVRALVSDLPDVRMNETAKQFAVALYAENRRSLSYRLRTMGA